MQSTGSEELEARRTRRAERRQKQREANFARAQKMHHLRIESGGIDASASLPTTRTFVGCSGWYYWHWAGRFYPEELPRNEWFFRYRREFRTVELNAPFYSWPTVAAVRAWLRQADGGFVYTVKVCELITHIQRFEDTRELVRDFGYIADLLGSHMGCFLYQLPPSFRYSPEALDAILKQLDPRHRNVVEFRHKSWWDDAVFRKFEAAGAIFCSVSGPRLRDALVKTADDVHVRFHGPTRWYRHDYSEVELSDWAGRIGACGAKRVWAYFNNDREANAVKNAHMLSQLLEKREDGRASPQSHSVEHVARSD
ncbi:DUF72 domain-containing protein [Rhizobium sp. Root708]|uniref:DUF72 domain-containing protein n=1 Tax=Rhizobium sp. Root708 TaxID=1736592 RepID=UPI000ADE4DA6|nr:DUF72 domain-containing protein [Rhizobium sp. Root708]